MISTYSKQDVSNTYGIYMYFKITELESKLEKLKRKLGVCDDARKQERLCRNIQKIKLELREIRNSCLEDIID